MILGIVGSEEAKFTAAGKVRAREMIRTLAWLTKADTICSGHCHLGGIDIWAEEVADELRLKKLIYPPRYLTWTFYKKRNIQIAENSESVYCLSVDVLPEGYKGMRFKVCYHCAGLNVPDHVKSGGCWTAKYARTLGKNGTTLVIENAG